MKNYRILAKKGEGTFSEVMRALNLVTKKQFAIKCMKKEFVSINQVNKLFEVQALRKLSGHPHIVQLHDVLFENHRLALVFELMDMNLYEAIKDRRSFLSEAKVTKWMYELFEAIDFIHSNQVFHRDVKPENLLIVDDVLKLADLGSCSPLNARLPFTEYIATRWYRAPECLITSGYYSSKMDIWAAGCVFFELMTLRPLFPGKTELDQIQKIHGVLGSPSDELFAHFQRYRGTHLHAIKFMPVKGTGISIDLSHCSRELVSIVEHLLTYDPVKRPSAHQVLGSSFFSKYRINSQQVRDVKIASPASTSAPLSSRIHPKVPLLALDKRAVLPHANPYWKTPRRGKVSGVVETSVNSARFRHLTHSHLRAPPDRLDAFVMASARNLSLHNRM